jgi:hypothetical protein
MTELNWQRDALAQAAPDDIAPVFVSSFGRAATWNQPACPRSGSWPRCARHGPGRTDRPRPVDGSVPPPRQCHNGSATVARARRIGRVVGQFNAQGTSSAVQVGERSDGRSGGSRNSTGPIHGTAGRVARKVAENGVPTGRARPAPLLSSLVLSSHFTVLSSPEYHPSTSFTAHSARTDIDRRSRP